MGLSRGNNGQHCLRDGPLLTRRCKGVTTVRCPPPLGRQTGIPAHSAPPPNPAVFSHLPPGNPFHL